MLFFSGSNFCVWNDVLKWPFDRREKYWRWFFVVAWNYALDYFSFVSLLVNFFFTFNLILVLFYIGFAQIIRTVTIITACADHVSFSPTAKFWEFVKFLLLRSFFPKINTTTNTETTSTRSPRPRPSPRPRMSPKFGFFSSSPLCFPKLGKVACVVGVLVDSSAEGEKIKWQ